MKTSKHYPFNLRREHLDNPIGLDETKPRLSWQLADARKGAAQTAYQITVASSPDQLAGKPDLWDSGQVRGDQCLDIRYDGKRLTSRQKAWWRVRYWDQNGAPSKWSQPAFFGIGLLRLEDWQAEWIGRPAEHTEDSGPSPLLRRGCNVRKDIKQACVFVTARGALDLYINGARVADEFFTPGWTDYEKRIQYVAYDVTDMLKPGMNTLGCILGAGWYASGLAWPQQRSRYGSQLSLLFQMEVEYTDGTTETIISDSSWKTSPGPILNSDIYNGETYDARLEIPGWNTNGFDDSSWDEAVVIKPPRAVLSARRNRPVRKQEEMPAQTQSEPAFGVHIFDLGQNMVGWARIKVRAPAGTCVRIRFAEMLNPDGTLYTENLRGAKCTDYYTCKGGGEEVYEPRFTFHGFRYVELTGLVEKPVLADVTEL